MKNIIWVGWGRSREKGIELGAERLEGRAADATRAPLRKTPTTTSAGTNTTQTTAILGGEDKSIDAHPQHTDWGAPTALELM